MRDKEGTAVGDGGQDTSTCERSQSHYGPSAAPASTSPLLNAALDYAARGWPVFPCHSVRDGACSCGKSDCGKSAAKHPRVEHGLKGATTDPAMIRSWWAKWPTANIAVLTGGASGLLVLDVDPDRGGTESLYDLQQHHGQLPPTPESLTGGAGTHLLFQHPGTPVKNSTGVLGPGLDVRGDGGYIIVEPSRHISGGIYEWDIEHHPDRLAPPPLPAWLLELVIDKPGGDGHRRAEPIPDVIAEGERNARLTSLAGSMRRRGASEGSILAALLAENGARCALPIEDTEIAKIAASVARYAPGPTFLQANGAVLVALADVAPERVRWLWHPYLPSGKLTVFMGDPEAGKSFLSLAVATAVTTGGTLPGGEAHDPANVLLLTAEDGLADTVRPRLDEMGAAVSRITVLTAVRQDDKERGFSLADDLLHLENVVAELRPAYVSIDPITAYMGRGVNTWQDSEVRGILGPLAALAERYGPAVSGIAHLTKSGRDRAIYRGQGSIAFPAAARSVLLVAESQDVDGLRVVAHVKCNLAAHGPSLGFTLGDGRFGWTGEVDVDPEALLAHKGAVPVHEAEAFLRGFLDSGPRLATDVEKKAEATGISQRTLYRAKKSLGVRSERQGGLGTEGEWVWVL